MHPLVTFRPLKSLGLLAFFCILSLPLIAQKKNANFRYHIKRSASAITLDGIPDEPAWLQADSTSRFFMTLPMDTSYAQVPTQVRMTYDENNLYVTATCFTPLSGQYMVESLKRDFAFQKNDNFILFMDPFESRTYGFAFGVNAAGAQWDGSMYEGGKVDLSWDNKWRSVVKNYSDRWVMEAVIPFKSIRYKKESREWGINFSRNDLKTTEKSAWAPVPRQFPTASLAYTGTLVWDEAPPATGTNVSLIPYVMAGTARDYLTNTPYSFSKDIGGDAKLALSSSLSLDLTLRPDFSQVDVDQQVTNLSRFELFFPEKRQFFLENGDLFANFGYGNIRPFFSRRIGLNAPIRYGARLSGKINKDWRIGAMDIQTDNVTPGVATSALGLPAQNYSVIALQRRVFARSNIGLLFINKETTSRMPLNDFGLPVTNEYNRNLGLEYNLASSNNLWTGKAMVIKSFTPGKDGDDLVQAANLQYLNRNWTINLQQERVGRNFTAEVGYIPRSAYFKLNPLILRNFFPKAGPVLSHGIQYTSQYYFNTAMERTDHENTLSYLVTFRDRTTVTSSVNHTFVRLLAPFDPTNIGKGLLAAGTEHSWAMLSTEVASRPQSLFTYVLGASFGGYYQEGSRTSLTSTLGYRFQPYVNIAMNITYNALSLPQPWGRTNFLLVGPRVDVTMTNKLYLTTFVQYNEQLKNVNVNSRLQWRYKPASDLFLVYTDNYLPSPIMVKNRQLVVKWTYWWNM